jgi:sugar phosphate isomerase/epimerase
MNLGLQLYSVRDEAEKDMPGVLEAVAQLGYQGVEFAGFFDHDLAQLRRLMASLGLIATGTHTPYQAIKSDIDRVIEDHHTLGTVYCTVPSYKADSVAGWREFARKLNGFARRFNDAGIKLSYHNHDFEFEPVEGQTPFAILREVCDSALVGLELDVAWAQKGGHDPAELITSLGGQCPLIHLKDLSQVGDDADIGTGLVDMGAVLSAADAAGVVWGIVERDSAPHPTLKSAEANLKALKTRR